MKVIGAGLLGAWSGYVVPGFDKDRLRQLPGAAMRYVLDDDRVDLLVIGMRLKSDIDANIETLAGQTTFTPADRSALSEFCEKAYESDAIKKLKIE
jgi:predicted aldo/keto reductase-like oxidoreductase